MNAALRQSLRARRLGSVLVLFCLAGCATVKGTTESAVRKDPWESWNRKVFDFNEGLDERVLKPAATAYQNIVPEPARQVVSNVITNVSDGWSAINHLLQAKWQSGFEMTVRVVTNTVFGFGGVLDIATEAGLDSQPEDLGQTLGKWGVASGPYVVWPVFGSSTLRDSAALPLDLQATPAAFASEAAAQLALGTLQVVNTRANLLNASRMVDDIAFDKYSFIRDAYLARRHNLVHDGAPPEQTEEGEPDEAPSAYVPAAPAAPVAPASAASGAG